MITLTTEQAQQIEEALEDIVRVFEFETGTPVEALATIRAARAQELNLNCKSVQKRLATQWGYVKADQAEQEPMMDYERINALREGEQNGAEDAYFFVRPENDTPSLRKMFCQGFERGFHKGLKYAAPVEPVKQEPVAWHEPNAYGNVTTHKKWAEENGWLPLYTKE